PGPEDGPVLPLRVASGPGDDVPRRVRESRGRARHRAFPRGGVPRGRDHPTRAPSDERPVRAAARAVCEDAEHEARDRVLRARVRRGEVRGHAGGQRGLRPALVAGLRILLAMAGMRSGMVKVVSPISHREVEAVNIDFDAKTEPWITVDLSDGTVLKIRTLVAGVMRMEGEPDPVGNPLYNVSTQIVIRVVNAPKELRVTPTGATTPPGRAS